jgi:hypothetical protein
MTKDWKEEFVKILNDWFKRILLFADNNFVGLVKGELPGFWAVEGKELEQFIESNFVSKLEHQTKLALARANAMQTRTATLGEVIIKAENLKNPKWDNTHGYNLALENLIKELKSTK